MKLEEEANYFKASSPTEEDEFCDCPKCQVSKERKKISKIETHRYSQLLCPCKSLSFGLDFNIFTFAEVVGLESLVSCVLFGILIYKGFAWSYYRP